MLRPSYSELMDIINTGDLVDKEITSRYTIVLAAAKRARQITSGSHALTYAPTDRAVSIAVKEMGEGKLTVKVSKELLESNIERRADQLNYQHISEVREDMRVDYETVPSTTDDEEPDDEAALFRERYGDSDLSEEAETEPAAAEFEEFEDEAAPDDDLVDYEDE